MSEHAARLRELLALHAERTPDRIALRAVSARRGAERALGWRELVAASDEAARGLARLAADAPLLVSVPNCAELPILLIAALGTGRTLLVASPELPAASLRRLADAVAARSWIGLPRDARRAELPGLPCLPIGEVLAGGSAAARPAGGALLLPTSGTTGTPKLARRGLGALLAVGSACADGIPIGPDDRVLLAIPLCHSYGIDQLFGGLVAGATLELHPSFEPARVLRALGAGRVSCLPAVPVMLDALARSADAAPSPALRRVVSAGSPLPRATFDRFHARFGVAIGQLYGATEFGSVTYNPPERAAFDPLAVGPPLPGVEVRILDAERPDPARPLPAGAEGAVAIASPSLLDGYHGDETPVRTSGFFVSGDLGRLDACGVLRLAGRRDLLLDVGAHKVDPLEVEAVLCRYPGVRDAAVLPLAMANVTRLRAVIVPEAGATLERSALLRFARAHLPPYMVPRSLELRDELPRSPAGKVLRSELLRRRAHP